MTLHEAKILRVLVWAAKQKGWHVPTGKELVDLLYECKVVHIRPRTANHYVKKFSESLKSPGGHSCFQKRKQSWLIDPKNLATERRTAQYFLAVDKKATQSQDSCVNIKGLNEYFQSQLNFDPEQLDIILEWGCKAGYLQVLPTSTEDVLSGDRIPKEKLYLEFLLSPYPIELPTNKSYSSTKDLFPK